MFCEGRNTWSEFLPAICFCLNCSTQFRTSAFNPFFLFLGRQPIINDGFSFKQSRELTDSPLDYIIQMEEAIQDSFKIVEENRYKARQISKSYYDRKVKQKRFIPGDIVYVSNPVIRSSEPVSKGLYNEKWIGPYVILSVSKHNVYLKDIKTSRHLANPISIRRIKLGYLNQNGYACSHLNSPETEIRMTNSVEQKEDDDEDVLPLPNDPKPLEDGFYQVERILSSFYCRKTKKRYFKIKWAGFAKSQASYEPEENIPKAILDKYYSTK